MQKWDYMYIDTMKVKNFWDNPNNIKELGEHGWELAGTVPRPNGDAILVFKRPKQE